MIYDVDWDRARWGAHRLNKENIPSRAYIAFRNPEVLATFSREYDGHVFRDKAGMYPTLKLFRRRAWPLRACIGNESIAIVEFAPFQKVPNEKKKPDARAGTIEKGARKSCMRSAPAG